MKRFLFVLFGFALLLALQPPPLYASQSDGIMIVQSDQYAPAVVPQEKGGVAVEPTAARDTEVSFASTVWNFIWVHKGALIFGLLSFYEIIARLTPTEKDNTLLKWLWILFNTIVPNNKKGGGTFEVSSKIEIVSLV